MDRIFFYTEGCEVTLHFVVAQNVTSEKIIKMNILLLEHIRKKHITVSRFNDRIDKKALKENNNS